MDGHLVGGLAWGGGVLAIAGVGFLGLRVRNGQATRLRRADVFARQVNLALPDGLVDQVADRLRRRASVAMAIDGLLVAGFMVAWVGWLAVGGFLSLIPPFAPTPLVPMAMTWVLGAIGLAVGHAYDVTHTHLARGPRSARITVARLGDVLPPIVIWVARAVSLLPAVTIAVIVAAPAARVQHPSVRDNLVVCVLCAVAAPVVTLGVELVQAVILRGRQRAATPQELAFDDAFRAQAILALVSLSLGLSYISTTVVIHQFNPMRHPIVGSDRFVILLGMIFVIGYLLTQLPWVRRYYRHQHLGLEKPVTGTGTSC